MGSSRPEEPPPLQRSVSTVEKKPLLGDNWPNFSNCSEMTLKLCDLMEQNVGFLTWMTSGNNTVSANTVNCGFSQWPRWGNDDKIEETTAEKSCLQPQTGETINILFWQNKWKDAVKTMLKRIWDMSQDILERTNQNLDLNLIENLHRGCFAARIRFKFKEESGGKTAQIQVC